AARKSWKRSTLRIGSLSVGGCSLPMPDRNHACRFRMPSPPPGPPSRPTAGQLTFSYACTRAPAVPTRCSASDGALCVSAARAARIVAVVPGVTARIGLVGQLPDETAGPTPQLRSELRHGCSFPFVWSDQGPDGLVS